MACGIFLLSSCKPNPSDSDNVNAHLRLVDAISQYVTCPTDSVEMMLASSDSICQWVDTCSLMSLNLYNEETNNYLDSLYRKEIPTILKLYGSYDVVSNFPTSEANAAFAWHELANALVAEYYGKEKADTADVEGIFKIVDHILRPYTAGTQYDMNISAWRRVVLFDYRLIGTYKALYDSCNEPSLLRYVQESYANLLEIYHNRCEQIEGYWSDLPRESAWMLIDMMEKRREMIEMLYTQYIQGKIAIHEVKAELEKRPEDVEWDIYDY